ncbi:MAG TPA: magnesium transporter [Dokdonella sp.]|nr:magnesium transporter [Dokdonella sp.]
MMTETETSSRSTTPLQGHLARVSDMLNRHRLVEKLAHGEAHQHHEVVDELVHRQNLAELQREIDKLHPADVAHILDALPPEDRLSVWHLVKADRDGEILLEVSDAVRETLLADMDAPEILAAAEQLDADELADLAEDLPDDVVHELMQRLDAPEREQLRSAMSYEEDQVGAIMDFEMITIREDVTLEVVLRYLRFLKEIPEQTDKLFVVNNENVLTGVVPLKWLLVNDPARMVSDVMAVDANTFHPDEDVADTAQAFERYDLISAPVVDTDGRLIGRVTIDAMVDVIREESDAETLSRGGLREDEDIFASVWKSLRNRWTWLAINLVTAFIASRVIGLFEGSIEKLVALAALMPIVAGIGGNSGNQTITMIVRALALGQVSPSNARRLLRKEVGVAVLNGLIWGGVIGLVAWLLYGNAALGAVMTAAMTLNLLLAALMGVLIPMTLIRYDRDPAMGSSVMITALTDSGGFFIFLGLATLFLI